MGMWVNTLIAQSVAQAVTFSPLALKNCFSEYFHRVLPR